MTRPVSALLVTLLLGSALECERAQAAQPAIVFDHYHSYAEITDFLRVITERHRELATLVEIGRSRAGRPIYAVEINDPATGPADEKSAFYLDGNIHGGEVLGGEAALYVVDLLLERFATDRRIRDLVRTRVFYIVPIVNPDGRVISVATPENHRWNIRPVDEDEDGRLDEDPPDDLDGDARILQMRVRDPEGEWVESSDDPRLMIRRTNDDRGPFYRIEREGIDDDHDGRYNEDRIGGVDLNRNFPSNWSPTQFASGPFPLSEPESRALAAYITARPNIAAVHTFHTSGGLILRFPTLADQPWDFPQPDLEDYDAIARRGAELTGYENYAYAKQPIVDLMNPGHGVFNDWASNVFGVLAITTEMWKHPGGRGSVALFEWNDEVLGGAGFVDWHRFEHPQLGSVELGGWDRWSLASPPESMMAAELNRNAQWVLTFAERLPRLAILEAAAISSDGSPAEVQLSATVANIGWMSTATAHAADVLALAKPVIARVTLVNAELVAGESSEQSLGILPGARDEPPADPRQVQWRVRVVDRARPATAEIVAVSEKAGTVRRRIDLGTETRR